MPIKSRFAPVEVADEPFPPRLLSAIWRHFTANPERMALVNAAREEDGVSFGELYAFSLATAAFLADRAFGRGDVACLALSNCWEYATIFLGVGLRGGALSGANPMFTHKEFERQFGDCRCKMVFCTPQNLNSVLRSIRTVPTVETIVLVESGQSKKALPPVATDLPFGIVTFGQVLRTEPKLDGDGFPVRQCRPEKDVLLLPYSSGTTGTPKGVMLSHRNIGTMLNIGTSHYRQHVHSRMEPPFAEGQECELLLLPFFHVYGFGSLLGCLLNGSTGVVMAKFEADLFCHSVQNFQIRLLKIVPPIMVFLAKNPKVDEYGLDHVQVLITGAAPAGRDICAELRKRLPKLQFVAQGFGMTEATVATHLPMLSNKNSEIGAFGGHSDAAGMLAANLEMKILDVESGKEVDQGMPGELHIRGPTIMLGYLGRPEATANTVDAEGWLRTGDIVYVDNEGHIHVVDRQKELIKVNGLQVAPAELEDLLLSHEDIQDCAVVGVPDPVAGELPRAFVVPRAGSTLSQDQVQQFVKAKAVYYKQLRGGVEFVDAIPKSPSGKILRRLLRDRLKKGGGGGLSKL